MNDDILRATGSGQSLWLDDITRDLLDRGVLRRYIDELRVTGHLMKSIAARRAALVAA